jgi:dihydrodiol dehydrogenase / D-xylose 1-dehydrogenase (NADP)
MKKQYNWGIMGAGIIARKMADAIGKDPRSTLLRVGSKSPERAEQFAREWDLSRYGDYETLLADRDIDIIYVATTHNFHCENGLAALNAGKHVVIEKPFTVNGGEARQLTELAAKKGLFLMEAIWSRFLPSWQRMRKMIREGVIGELKLIDATFGKFIPPEFEKRLVSPELAGGATLDLGIYPLSFSCFMAGELPEKADSDCLFSSTGVDETVNYRLTFPSGVLAQIGVSYRLWTEDRATLYGTKGAIFFNSIGGGDRFTLKLHGGGNTIELEQETVLDQEENGFVYQVAETVRCLDAGLSESPEIPLGETVAIMELMDRMRGSWPLRYPFEE